MRTARADLLLRLEAAALVLLMVVACVPSIVAAASPVEGAKPQAAFKGFVLGQTIEAAKAVPMEPLFEGKVSLSCSSDEKPAIFAHALPEERDAGLIRCTPATFNHGYWGIEPLKVTPTVAAFTTLDFVDGVLVSISTEYNALDVGVIESGLVAKYGTPQILRRRKIQTESGDWYDRQIAIWIVAGNFVELNNPGARLDRISVVYESPAADAFRRKLVKLAGSKVDF